MKNLFIAMLMTLGLAGCTERGMASWEAYGSDAHVICYSATEVIYEGRSEGRVFSTDSSDGYQFRDSATGKLTEVSGNCVITY